MTHHIWPFAIAVVTASLWGCASAHSETGGAGGSGTTSVTTSTSATAASSSTGGIDHGPPATWTSTMVGSPNWKPTDFHIVLGTIGVAEDNFAAYPVFLAPIVPNHKLDSQHNFWPSAKPHQGFETELAGQISALSVPDVSRMTVMETTAPNGMLFAFAVIPTAGAPIGSSPDSASGPILDPSRMGIDSDGNLFRGSELIDPAFDTYYPRPDEVAFPGQLDGWSHLLLFYAESSAFVQFTPENDYRFDVHLRDKLADGWDLTVHFAVQ